MIYAAIRQGPVNALRLKSINEAAARKVPGMIGVIRPEGTGWVAVTARNWWAANQALDRLDPVFELAGPAVSDRSIAGALDAAFEGDDGGRYFSRGDLDRARRLCGRARAASRARTDGGDGTHPRQ
jgi:isoquinoline 1-oxidoreductase beta subunit